MNGAVLAGRRVDTPSQREIQFPLSNIDMVREQIASYFQKYEINFLICSAACGADLIALDVALQKGIRFAVILPFNVDTFVETSVVDRPGPWLEIFDRIIQASSTQGQIINLNLSRNQLDAFSIVNEAIFNFGLKIDGLKFLMAIVVWEGHPRNGPDHTSEFLKIAKRYNLDIRQIRTI